MMVWTGTALRAQALFEQTELFVGGQDNYNTYRIPSLICTKNGTYWPSAKAEETIGKDGGPTDIVLKRSPGNAGKWTPAYIPLKAEGRYQAQHHDVASLADVISAARMGKPI